LPWDLLRELAAPDLARREIAFGNYAAGRWAWGLDVVEMMPEPVPTPGMQGNWIWMPPT
jgi:hypothetical protein